MRRGRRGGAGGWGFMRGLRGRRWGFFMRGFPGGEAGRRSRVTRLSVASVAVDYARRIFDHFDDKTILNIGAGKMAALALRNFADLKLGRLLLCNRDASKAEKLAKEFGGEAAAFEQLDEHLVAAD